MDLATRLLGLDINPGSLALIETESRRIEERRAEDLVARVRDRGGDKFILHIEIQNDDQRMMPWRLPVRQYLIHIGRQPLSMADGMQREGLDYLITSWTCVTRTARSG